MVSPSDRGEVVGDRLRVLQSGDGTEVPVGAHDDSAATIQAEPVGHQSAGIGDDGIVTGHRSVLAGHQDLDLAAAARGRGNLPGRDCDHAVARIDAYSVELLLDGVVGDMWK